MSSRPSFFSSTVGSKILIGLTGLLLFGFLIAHLAGNLSLLAGADAFNLYAYKLESLGPLIYLAEAGLVAIFLLHIVKTLGDVPPELGGASGALPGKEVGGPHEPQDVVVDDDGAHGPVHPLLRRRARADVQVRPLVRGAGDGPPRPVPAGRRDLPAIPLYAGFYVVAMGLIGMHLNHGISSAAQSLGLSNQRLARNLVLGGRVLAVLIAGGFAILPMYMYFAHQVAQ